MYAHMQPSRGVDVQAGLMNAAREGLTWQQDVKRVPYRRDARNPLPDGQIGIRFLLFIENNVKPSLEKYFTSVFRNIVIICSVSRPDKRGASADRHERGTGCDGRVGARETNGANADGEVAWSWRPDAGVKSRSR